MADFRDHHGRLVSLIYEALNRAQTGRTIDLEETEILLVQAADEARQARGWKTAEPLGA